MIIAGEDYSKLIGKVDDATLENLTDYFTENQIDKKNLIFLVDKKHHLERIQKTFNIDVEDCSILEIFKVQNSTPSLELISFLEKNNYSHLEDLYIAKIIPEYILYQKNKDIPVPEKIKNKIRFIFDSTVVKNNNYHIFTMNNPIVFISFFNEKNIRIIRLLKPIHFINIKKMMISGEKNIIIETLKNEKNENISKKRL